MNKRLLQTKICALFMFFSSVSFAQSGWKILGNETQIASANSNFTSIVTITTNEGVVPYLAFTEEGIPKVKKFENSAWSPVGGNVSAGSASHLNLAVDKNGKLYLCYVDGTEGNKLAVKTYNTTTDTWEAAGSSLHVSSGSVLNGQSEERIPYNNAISFDSNNVPYVAFGEFPSGAAGAGNAWVKRLQAGEWATLGSGAVNTTDRANSIDIDLSSDNTPYIVYHDGTTSGQIKAFRYTNNSWNDLMIGTAVNNLSTGAARTTRIAIDKITDKVVVNFSNAADGTRAFAITMTPQGSWTTLGGRIGSGSAATYTSTISDPKGNLYTLFRDQMSNSSPAYKVRLHENAVNSKFWAEVAGADGFDGPASGYTTLAFGSDNNMYVAYIKINSSSKYTPVVQVLQQEIKPPADVLVTKPKQMEHLDRGLIAVRSSSTQTFLSWRLLGTDPSDISFNLYRDGVKVNTTPITGATNYTDNTNTVGTYVIRPILNGQERGASAPAIVWGQNFLSVPLQIPAGGTTPDGVSYTYLANDCSVGDLDGDGVYEIVLKWEPTNSSDNGSDKYSGSTIFDAYKLDGTRLWRIDLGKNIRSGAHYNPFTVYDLNGDGKAELACRTADGTVDGTGKIIGDPNVDYRNAQGRILTGPEFLTIFNGQTGAAMATADYYPERGAVTAWGDDFGNRVDRFVDAVAYLDGEKPSLVTGRGYYTRQVRVAWDWRDGKLTRRWVFDSSTLGNSRYAGQGNHQMSVADVDGDGRDEVFNGSSAINDNGEGLWTDGKGHGDAMHITDLDPDRPGLEMWTCMEDESSYVDKGLIFRSAENGTTLFGVNTTGDIGRCMTADIDPRHKGYEVWGPRGGLYNAKGVEISTARPTTMNFGIWWDGDLQREFLDDVTISKWNHLSSTTSPILSAQGVSSNNSTKATPNLSADIFGDWREEVIWRTSDNSSLRIYTTTAATTHRIPTLMHDPQYRVAIAWQNSGYNQPPYPSFYIGSDMAAAPQPNVIAAGENHNSVPATPSISTPGAANGSVTVCEGTGATLSSSSLTGNQWYKNDEAIEGAVFNTYNVTSAGTYTVKVSNDCCESALSSPLTVTVIPSPAATLTAGGPTTFPLGGQVVLSANTGTGYTYKWEKDGVEIQHASGSTYTASTAGVYTVKVSAGACTSTSASVTISTVFTLPATNFKVSATSETCRASNDGKISVLATATDHTYSASLKKGSATTTHNFTNSTLEINGLSAGEYELCISVAGQSAYKQCYNVTVSEPTDLSVYSSVDRSNNTVELTLSGATAYTVELNDRIYQTRESKLSLDLSATGNNILKVYTDSPCQGVIERTLTAGKQVLFYPNPVDTELNIALATPEGEKIEVEILSTGGTSVYRNQHVSHGGNVLLNLSHLQAGIYIVKVKTRDTEVSYKIVKK